MKKSPVIKDPSVELLNGNAFPIIAIGIPANAKLKVSLEKPQTPAGNKKVDILEGQETDLEEIVKQRTLELSDANEELLKMNKELESFTYISSHDLQEPLRKIQMYAAHILEKEIKNLSETGKDYFHKIENAASRMQKLILDLLAFSRVNTAERNYENTDLNILIQEVLNEFKEVIEEKQAIIETRELCEARIIPFQFRQLMQNLIGNALKFSPPEKQPHIIIKSKIATGSELPYENPSLPKGRLSLEKKYCHISITDKGIGFEPEYSDKIFEVFQRLHSKGVYAGTGIGLAIVKKIVENHKGIITATSKLGQGARFDVYLPQ